MIWTLRYMLGYTVRNPCRVLVTYHNHCSKVHGPGPKNGYSIKSLSNQGWAAKAPLGLAHFESELLYGKKEQTWLNWLTWYSWPLELSFHFPCLNKQFFIICLINTVTQLYVARVNSLFLSGSICMSPCWHCKTSNSVATRKSLGKLSEASRLTATWHNSILVPQQTQLRVQ